MTEPAAVVVPPNHVTGEHRCATPERECPSNGKVATRPFVYFAIGKERLKTVLMVGSAIGLCIGSAWVLTRSSSADASDALAAHVRSEEEFHRETRAEMKDIGKDVRDTRDLVQRTLGPLSPTPAVREP